MAFTFFFRDSHVLELVADHLVPEIMGRNRPHIWDAGCAMGPEPFTLAMILAERMGSFAFKNLRILASDLDDTQTFGGIIKCAEYSVREIERIPDLYRTRYFVPSERAEFTRVCPLITDRISFQQHDLLSLHAPGSNFSLILCKNVLLHFDPQQRVKVIQMFHQSLAPRGILAFEQTQKLPTELLPLFEPLASDGQVFRRI